MNNNDIINKIKTRKIIKTRKRSFKKAMLALILAMVPVALVGCNGQDPDSIEEIPIVQNYDDYRPEGYFNRFPIQIGIEDDFDETNRELIIESLTELDNALDGVRFEYYVFDSARPSRREYSYISIFLDQDGVSTIEKYEVPGKEESTYAWARINSTTSFARGDYTPYKFDATVNLGSYFTISNDIPDSDKWMGLELKWDNYDKYSAYVDTSIFINNNYWDFNTTYSDFEKNIQTAFKGLVKHEIGHALGYKGDSSENCKTDYCHSSNKDSIMYEWFNDKVKANNLTDDVVAYFQEKYPDDESER